ncbi:MAG: OmpA family protein [Myxococcota bacterium]
MLLAALPIALAFDADTFELSGSALDERGGLQLASPELGFPGGFYAGVAGSWSKNPLVKVYEDGSQEPVVGSSVATHLAAGYTLGKLARVDLDVPLYPYQGAVGAEGFAAGDVRLGAVVPVVRGEFALAVVPALVFPTGNADAYTGGAFGGGLGLSAGASPGRSFLLANLAVDATRTDTLGDLQVGTGMRMGAGGGVHVSDALTLGAEIDSMLTLAGGLGPFNKNPVELHGYASYGRGGGVTATLGAGTGLVAGVGAPDLRLVAMIGYHGPGAEPNPDTDEDGVPDAADKCADGLEDLDGFEDGDGCADVDDDRDRIADGSDACRFDAEDYDRFEDGDGCPEKDNDEDGLADDLDACPDTKGPGATGGCPDKDTDALADHVDSCPDAPGPRSTKGCPDRDYDLVADRDDTCPTEPRDPREDLARTDGCPKRVFVGTDRIDSWSALVFDANRATLTKDSQGLLDEIAQVLNANLDITRVEVGVHTADLGDDAKALKLSQARAQAIVDHLVKKGLVDASRLTAVGYGDAKPPQNQRATDRAELLIREVAKR